MRVHRDASRRRGHNWCACGVMKYVRARLAGAAGGALVGKHAYCIRQARGSCMCTRESLDLLGRRMQTFLTPWMEWLQAGGEALRLCYGNWPARMQGEDEERDRAASCEGLRATASYGRVIFLCEFQFIFIFDHLTHPGSILVMLALLGAICVVGPLLSDLKNTHRA